MIETKTTRRRTIFQSPNMPSLRLVREGGRATEKLQDPKQVKNFLFQFFQNEATESLVVLMLDAQNKVIGNAPVIISRGLVNGSLSHPREVFRPAIAAGAVSIILAHNHPSGDTTPSAEDRHVTRQIYEAGKLLCIPLLDHVIIGDENYFSFAEQGIMPL